MSPAVVALLGVLAQAATPSGGTVTGLVLDEVTRAPVAGARVNLLRPPGQPDPAGVSPTPFSTTAADGRFVFSNVAAGEYTLSASRDGYGLRMLPPVTVERGATVEAPPALLAPAATIVGRLLAPDGQPVVGAAVIPQRRLRQPTNPAAGARPVPRFDAIAPRDLTDGEGRFTVQGVPPGEYVIRIAAGRPRHSDAIDGRAERLVPGWFPGTPDPDGAVTVVTSAGRTTDLGDIHMATTAAFRVVGHVLDDGGRPIPNVSVRLVPDDAPQNALPVGLPVISDAAGVFVLDAVLPGRYLLVAVPPAPAITNHPAGPGFNATSSQLGGRTPESRAGSIMTVTRDGVTREYRDERATTVPLDVVDAPLPDVRVTLTRR